MVCSGGCGASCQRSGTHRQEKGDSETSLQVLAAEPGPPPTTDKKIKPNALVVAVIAPTQGVWCPINETNSHDLKSCRIVYGLT
jgi:hypothetical protein